MTQRAHAVVLACAFVVACGSSADPSASSSPPAPQPPANDTPAQPQTAPTREGNVIIATTGDTITGGAEFGPKYPAGVPLEEGCTLISDPTADAKSQGESDSAGIIDVDVVLASQPNALHIEFNRERKNYQYFNLGTNGHASGKIRVRAHGDVVPAFEAEIDAIPPTQISSPAEGAAIGARDLPVSWSFDGEDRHSIVYLTTLHKDVRCYVPKGRELVIPAALVGEVLATNEDPRLFILTAKTTQVDAGDYRISLSHDTSTWVELTRE